MALVSQSPPSACAWGRDGPRVSWGQALFSSPFSQLPQALTLKQAESRGDLEGRLEEGWRDVLGGWFRLLRLGALGGRGSLHLTRHQPRHFSVQSSAQQLAVSRLACWLLPSGTWRSDRGYCLWQQECPNMERGEGSRRWGGGFKGAERRRWRARR